MQNVKVAAIGCGYFSAFHYQAWNKLNVDLVGVCDQDLEKASLFKEKYGIEKAYSDFEEMLQSTQPDIVDIILPPAAHFEHLKTASAHKRVIICQKPFTENLEQARDAVDLVNQSQSTLIVHENFRFQPWYRKIKQIIEAGELGEIYQIRFDLRPGDGQGPNAYLDRQPYFQKMPQFLIRETGIHFVDVFRYLLGEPKSVWSDLRKLNPAIAGEDAGIFVLEFENQCRAIFDGNRLSDHAADNPRLTMGEMRIDGALATLNLNGFGEIQIRRRTETTSKPVQFDWEDVGFAGDCVYHMQKQVLECLASGHSHENDSNNYLKNLEIQEKIYNSNISGERMKV